MLMFDVMNIAITKIQFYGIFFAPIPNKHTMLFPHCNNVVDVQTTLYRRQNDDMCLMGYTLKSFLTLLSVNAKV